MSNLIYFLKLIVKAAKGKAIAAFIATFKISLIITPFFYLVDRLGEWYITNQSYAEIVFVAILIDYVLGSIKHIKNKTFEMKKNVTRFILKIFLCFCAIVLFEGFNFIVQDSFIYRFMKIATRLAVFLYPAISGLENIYEVSGHRFPPQSWIEKLKQVQKSGNPKDFKK